MLSGRAANLLDCILSTTRFTRPPIALGNACQQPRMIFLRMLISSCKSHDDVEYGRDTSTHLQLIVGKIQGREERHARQRSGDALQCPAAEFEMVRLLRGEFHQRLLHFDYNSRCFCVRSLRFGVLDEILVGLMERFQLQHRHVRQLLPLR